MKHVIIGTAGHVDHGKTTLIKALTGTDTDRLKEEQERGMTIDLGFAALTLPDGAKAGIVDVPGHERFLKNMLAGAGGVDVVLLVIAADESVMPQTSEHLDILRLLDVKNGVVALTKADMVDEEWLQIVEDDIRGQLKGTFLASAPIVAVDSISGRGIPELRKELFNAVERAEGRNAALPFRLPVDRVFTRPGFGTVITGTLVSGTMRVGDAVDVLPLDLHSRIRGLQSHGKKQEQVEAGSRVAVNLAGVETASLQRGAVLAPPNMITPTQICDAVLKLLPGLPRSLTNRSRVRVYIGTAEILGRIQILSDDQLEPDSRGYVQFRGEEHFVCVRGDRFVVRSYSPMLTIGGGIILDTSPQRHKRNDPNVLSALEAKERGSPEDLVSTWLQISAAGGFQKDIAKLLGLEENEVAAAAEILLECGELTTLEGGRLVHRSILATVTDRAMQALAAFHSSNPLRPGMPREELRGALGKQMDPRTFAAFAQKWQADGIVRADAAVISLADFKVQLGEQHQRVLDRIAGRLRETGFNTPTAAEIAEEIKVTLELVNAMIRVGQDQGTIVKVSDGLYFHSDTMNRARRIVQDHIREKGSITVSEFRDITGSSRKYALPIMEYFDSVRLTRRLGDNRVLVT